MEKRPIHQVDKVDGIIHCDSFIQMQRVLEKSLVRKAFLIHDWMAKTLKFWVSVWTLQVNIINSKYYNPVIYHYFWIVRKVVDFIFGTFSETNL